MLSLPDCNEMFDPMRVRRLVDLHHNTSQVSCLNGYVGCVAAFVAVVALQLLTHTPGATIVMMSAWNEPLKEGGASKRQFWKTMAKCSAPWLQMNP